MACRAGPLPRLNAKLVVSGDILTGGRSHSYRRVTTRATAAGDENDSRYTTILAADGSSMSVSKVGIGTLQWGDEKCGFGTAYGEQELSEAFGAAVWAQGLRDGVLFD